MKGTEMLNCPYSALLRYKFWAMNALYAAIGNHLDRIAEADQILILRLLDHINAVDDIFSHNLEGRPHGYSAPRSAELPAFEALADKAGRMAAWYADYADTLTPERRDEMVDFTFSNGAPGRMTRGEMLLHVASHGIYHGGNIGVFLHKYSIEPLPGSMTEFLEMERTAPA